MCITIFISLLYMCATIYYFFHLFVCNDILFQSFIRVQRYIISFIYLCVTIYYFIHLYVYNDILFHSFIRVQRYIISFIYMCGTIYYFIHLYVCNDILFHSFQHVEWSIIVERSLVLFIYTFESLLRKELRDSMWNICEIYVKYMWNICEIYAVNVGLVFL